MFKKAIKKAISSPPSNFVLERCPDQYVGLLQNLNCCSKDFACRLPTDISPLPDKRVLLIIESPHKKEFAAPFGPAKGTTGELIRRYLREIIASLASEDFGLFLMNAIQYQCSLGHPPKNFRDVVFPEVWHQYGRDDFIQRLRALACGYETLVINACTKGRIKDPKLMLRQLVEDGIYEGLRRASDIRITHPASWASQYNRCAFW